MTYTAPSRIQTIDIIRGIALFGILVINTQSYTLFTFLQPQQVYDLGLDKPQTYAPLQFLIHLLFQGQFHTIYSFLFGLGFYLMMQKNKQLGLNGNKLFRRRLGVLFIFGMLHAFVFWHGDILHQYALIGFTLVYFNKKSVPALFKWVAGLFIYIIFVYLIKTLFFPVSPAAVAENQQKLNAVVMQVVDTWQHGSFLQVLRLQKLGVVLQWIMSVQNGLAGFVEYLIMFLLGLIAGKLDVFNRVLAFRPKLKKIARWLFVPAILLKTFSTLRMLQLHLFPASNHNYENAAYALAGYISTPLLTVVYLIFLTLVLENKQGRFFTWIGNTGRLGLTNYLAQTLICMILFYGYALGFSGRLTLLQSFAFIVPIYCFQVVYSNLWLRHHKMGPMENLWRQLTYGSRSAENKRYGTSTRRQALSYPKAP